MSRKKLNTNSKKAGKKSEVYILSGILAVLVIAVIAVTSIASGPKDSTASTGGGIQITKSQITETAAFIPYKSGNIRMEIIAVKAHDGTIRTAFNTCQVCYDSGRGYYVQEGDRLICQNCGNSFKISQLEKEKNGCNPVPITQQDKIDDGQVITISEKVLKENAAYFRNWKR